MTTALTKTNTGGGLAAFSGDNNPFLADAVRAGTDNGNTYISFSGNTGKWTFKGQEIDEGAVFAFDLMNAERGWIAWKGGKPVEKLMFSILNGDPIPDESTLTDHWDGVPPGKRPKETDGWREIVSVMIRDLDGGPDMELSLPGSPGYRPINRLLKEFGSKVRMKMVDGEYMVPLVEIGSESFDGKGGKKYAPILTLTDWISRQELDNIEISAPAEAEVVEEVVKTSTVKTTPGVRPTAGSARPTGRRV